MLCCRAGADRLRAPPLEVLRFTEDGNSAWRTANVRGRKAESIGRRRIEACDDKVAPQNDDRNADRIKDFSDVGCRGIQIVVGRRWAESAPTSTVGDGRQGHFALPD